MSEGKAISIIGALNLEDELATRLLERSEPTVAAHATAGPDWRSLVTFWGAREVHDYFV